MKLLLFDIDGTLLKTEGVGRLAVCQAAKDVFGVEEDLIGITVAGNTDGGILRDLLSKHGFYIYMRKKCLTFILLGTLCFGACQSQKPAQITDPNAVFAQGGAHAESSGTPTRGGGRRSRGQSQGLNAAGVND